MFYEIPRGWFTYTDKGIQFLPIKDEAFQLWGCKTCKVNNYDTSIICLDCRRAHR